METKTCTKCGEEKPLCEYQYRTDISKYRSYCKCCDSVRQKEWRLKNKNHLKKYAEKNREKRKEYMDKYNKEYREKNKERLKENDRSRKFNPRYIEWRKEYQEKTKERRKENKKEWEDKNREHIRSYARAYHKKTGFNKTYKSRQMENLEDGYIIHQIYKRTGMNAEEIKQCPELIEQKRAIIQLKRTIKIYQNGKNSSKS